MTSEKNLTCICKMKKIIATWRKTKDGGKELFVVYSDHEKYTKGTRFDFGFLQIASSEGFIVEILP